MLHQVKLFFDHVILDPMKYWVEAMEAGLVHVDAVNEHLETFGVVCVRTVRNWQWLREYWLRYWALKPSPEKFWRSLTNTYDHLTCARDLQRTVLYRMADIPALWEDLPFLYNLAAGNGRRLAWLLPELDRRMSAASLRFAWIAAAVVW